MVERLSGRACDGVGDLIRWRPAVRRRRALRLGPRLGLRLERCDELVLLPKPLAQLRDLDLELRFAQDAQLVVRERHSFVRFASTDPGSPHNHTPVILVSERGSAVGEVGTHSRTHLKYDKHTLGQHCSVASTGSSLEHPFPSGSSTHLHEPPTSG